MTTRTPIYLDHNATTPATDAAKAAMFAVMDAPLNASSVHRFGRDAKKLLDRARAQIRNAVNAENYHVIFTATGTEANNLALKGGAWCLVPGALFVSAVEHASVLNTAPDAARIPVDTNGIINLHELQKLLSTKHEAPGTTLVSIQLANNETGVIQPIAEIAQLVHEAGGMLHVDAVQGLGKIAVDVSKLNADMLTLSSHKIGGPLGAAALLVKPGIELKGQIIGGGQELGLRAGTENVPAIVGFGVAAEGLKFPDSALRDYLEVSLPEAVVFGYEAARLPNTSCIGMPSVSNETQLIHFDLEGIAVSAGSACSSGKVKLSHVLTAMGVAKETAHTAIRVSLSAATTKQEIDQFIASWKALFARSGGRKAA